MARAIWSGSISFGMLAVPVKLYGATESKDVAFNNLHVGCGSRIKQQRTCPVHDVVLQTEDMERGYEYDKGAFVVVSDDDLDSLPLPTKQIIDLSSFVAESEVDRMYTEKAYFLEPEPVGAKAYRLLVLALEQKQVMGVGKIALRTKERMCTVRACQGVLVLETLFWPDEVRELRSGVVLPEVTPTQPELDMAYMLVESFYEPFDPAAYSNGYRAALLELIDAKRGGTPLAEPPPAPKPPADSDLMAMLKATIATAKAEKAAAAPVTTIKKPRKPKPEAA